MKKIISLMLLVVLLALTLFGCNVQNKSGETNDDQTPTKTQIACQGVKVLDKYDDLLRAMELISESGNFLEKYEEHLR